MEGLRKQSSRSCVSACWQPGILRCLRTAIVVFPPVIEMPRMVPAFEELSVVPQPNAACTDEAGTYGI